MDHLANKSDMQAEKCTSNPLARKISKILETRLENDKGAVEALKELSTFFPENTLRARRNLRGQIERRTVTINQEFVAALKGVKEAIDNIYNDVKAINSQCSEMKTKLEAAKTETKHLTEQTVKLHKQRSVLEMQQKVAGSFCRTFLLTSEEISCLNTATINPAFFAALNRTHAIHTNTKHLLQGSDRVTALEVTAQCSEVQEAAVTSLYRWLLQQARHSDVVHNTVQLAMAAIEDRPQLYKLVIEEWVVVRRGALNRQFLHSLTHLSPSHSPIELGAHSPTRYVGDMLAWLHQALAGEREVMGALLGGCKTVDVSAETSVSVARIAESVCRPLKTRVEQIIVSSEHRHIQAPTSSVVVGAAGPAHQAAAKGVSGVDASTALAQLEAGHKRPVLLYKMSGLLHFYHTTIAQLTGAGVLVSTLEELQQLSHKMFLAALYAQVVAGCEQLTGAPPPCLSPAPPVTSLLSLLTTIITAATLTTHHDHTIQVVDAVITPMLQSLASLGGGEDSSVESCVYALNSYNKIHATLSLLHTPGTDTRLSQLQQLMDCQLTTLSNLQFSAVSHSLGLTQLMALLSTVGPAGTGVSKVISASALQVFLAKLDHFLTSPDSYLLPAVQQLVSSGQRRQCVQHTSTALLDHYTALHHAVHHASSGFASPDKLMPKTPDVVKALVVL